MSDLSDEAFVAWVKENGPFGMLDVSIRPWQECRRRAEAMLEERDAKIEELQAEITILKIFGERKAFEAGWKYADQMHKELDVEEGAIDEVYRAYQAAQEKA
jgi:hypothetical protein